MRGLPRRRTVLTALRAIRRELHCQHESIERLECIVDRLGRELAAGLLAVITSSTAQAETLRQILDTLDRPATRVTIHAGPAREIPKPLGPPTKGTT